MKLDDLREFAAAFRKAGEVYAAHQKPAHIPETDWKVFSDGYALVADLVEIAADGMEKMDEIPDSFGAHPEVFCDRLDKVCEITGRRVLEAVYAKRGT